MKEKILGLLDGYLGKNDYVSAEAHLLSCLKQAQSDGKSLLLINNELMGLYRKLGKREQALDCTAEALRLIEQMNIENNIGAATTYLNCGTVYNAFSMPEKSIELFEKARQIYESRLSRNDSRLAGLYNNMALSLVAAGDYSKAELYYKKALDITLSLPGMQGEAAITWLNIASAAEAEKGMEKAEDEIGSSIKKAWELLEKIKERSDGGYAFICEKCAPVFGYYGYFRYEGELKERAQRIYEGN